MEDLVTYTVQNAILTNVKDELLHIEDKPFRDHYLMKNFVM